MTDPKDSIPGAILVNDDEWKRLGDILAAPIEPPEALVRLMSKDRTDPRHRLIVCGSRWLGPALTSYIFGALDLWMAEHGRPAEVLSGMCPDSPDMDAVAWAESRGLVLRPFPADWTTHGRAAGPKRNAEMAAHAIDGVAWAGCIAFHDGESRGTADMIRRARAKGLRVRVLNPAQ